MNVEAANCGACGRLTNVSTMRQVTHIRYEVRDTGGSPFPYTDGTIMVCPKCFDELRGIPT